LPLSLGFWLIRGSALGPIGGLSARQFNSCLPHIEDRREREPIRTEGTKVSHERKFQGTKVLGTFAPEEQKFHGSECSRERKFLERSLPRNESSTGAKVPRERKFHLWTVRHSFSRCQSAHLIKCDAFSKNDQCVWPTAQLWSFVTCTQ